MMPRLLVFLLLSAPLVGQTTSTSVSTRIVSTSAGSPKDFAGDKLVKKPGTKTREIAIEVSEAEFRQEELRGTPAATTLSIAPQLLQRYKNDLLFTGVTTLVGGKPREYSTLFRVQREIPGSVEIIPGSSSSPRALASVSLLALRKDGFPPGLPTGPGAGPRGWRDDLAAAISSYNARYKSAVVRTGKLMVGDAATGTQLGTGLLIGADRVLTNHHVFSDYVASGSTGRVKWVPLCILQNGLVDCGDHSARAVHVATVSGSTGCDGALPSTRASVGRDCAIATLKKAPDVGLPDDWVWASGLRHPDSGLLLLTVPTSRLPPCSSSPDCFVYNACIQGVQRDRLRAVAEQFKGGVGQTLSISFTLPLSACPEPGKTTYCGNAAEGCLCQDPDLTNAVCYLGATMPGSSGGAILDIHDLSLVGIHAGGDRRGYQFNYGLAITEASLRPTK